MLLLPGHFCWSSRSPVLLDPNAQRSSAWCQAPGLVQNFLSINGSTWSLLSPCQAQHGVSVLPEELTAHGSREHLRGHTAHRGQWALEWKAASQQLGTQMKSTSWVGSAISSSAQRPAHLQGMKRSILLGASPHAIQATPQIRRFCTLWGTLVLGEHGKHPPRSSPHSAVAEGTHTGWTHDIPHHRAGWGSAVSS